jgi:hypothetical protein
MWCARSTNARTSSSARPYSTGDPQAQSFAELLRGNPPDKVREKRLSWGVADYAAAFARAVAMNSIFTEPPKFDLLSAHFLAPYHQNGEALFRCFMELQPLGKSRPPLSVSILLFR